jgi:cyanophycin synthetase
MPDQKLDDIHHCFFLQAAENLGLSGEILDEGNGMFRIANREQSALGCHGVLKLNSKLKKAFANHKFLTIQLLARSGIPVPKSELFDLAAEAAEVLAATRNTYPLVAKPIHGTSGDGVATNIMSEAELAAAITVIRDLVARNRRQPPDKQFILENHVTGEDYRILMYRGKIMDVVHRTPACVVGDGRSTVRELIAEKNVYRDNYHPSRALIMFDSDLTEFLAIRAKSLETIPAADEKVILRRVCNETKGGEVHRLSLDQIAPDNLRLFARIEEVMGLEMCGIDFITSDISESYKDTVCCVNEVNPTPGIQPHCWNDPQPFKLDVAEAVLERCFGLTDS